MVEIQSIEKSEYEDLAKNIVSKGVGVTYAENVRSLEKCDSILLIARIDDSIVGFACGYNSDNPEEYIESLETDTGANSILEKISILHEYRGQGIGTELYRERLRRLQQPTIAESWIRTDSPDSTILMEKFGFKKIHYIENKWYEESQMAQDDNFCPDCGRICKCDSAIYILDDFDDCSCRTSALDVIIL